MDLKKISAVADRISFVALTAMLGLLPVFSLPFAGVASEASKGVLLSVGTLLSFVFWLGARFCQGKVSMPRSLILIAGKTLMLALVLSALFSGAVRASFWGAGFGLGSGSTFILLYLVLFLCAAIFQDKKKRFQLAVAILGAGALAVLFQFSHLFFSYATAFHGFLSAPTANLVGKWNDLGIYLSFIALMSLGIIRFFPLEKRLRIALYSLFSACFFFMIAINFLAAWIIFALVMIVVCIYEWMHRAPETKPLLILSASVASFSILFILLNGFIGAFVPTHLHTLSLEVRPSLRATASVVSHTLAKHPLLGVGPGHFAESWVMYRPTSVLASQFWNTDFDSGFGLLPSLFATSGLLGGLALVFLLGSFLYQAMKMRIFALKDETKYLAGGTFVLTLFLWLMTVVYVPNIALMGMTFAMTGIFVAMSAGKKASDMYALSFARDRRMKIIALVATVILSLAVIVFGFISVRQFVAAVYSSRSAAALSTGSIEDAGQSMSRALAIDPNDQEYRAMTDLYLAKANTLLSTPGQTLDAIKPELGELFGSARQSALLATEYDASNYLNWIELARFYQTALPLGLQDAYVDAKTTYMKALALNPTNPSIYLSIANLDLAEKNTDMARQDIASALAIKPDYTDAFFLLAKIAQDSGDVQEAIRQVQKAELADPASFAAAFDLGILEYSVKDYANAGLSLEHAVILNPTNLDARYFLGVTYDAIGRKEDALAQFQYIASQTPENQEIKTIIANLQAGRSALEPVTKSSGKK
jgi:tetratricopeptide (TPR) repeat protein